MCNIWGFPAVSGLIFRKVKFSHRTWQVIQGLRSRRWTLKLCWRTHTIQMMRGFWIQFSAVQVTKLSGITYTTSGRHGGIFQARTDSKPISVLPKNFCKQKCPYRIWFFIITLDGVSIRPYVFGVYYQICSINNHLLVFQQYFQGLTENSTLLKRRDLSINKRWITYDPALFLNLIWRMGWWV